ncbi:phytanoyl-CoA dioxygenase family protein [Chondromyces crocatus]|uniref:Phytanoyl-CoA dioxygenase n=1 Tax=Chondromyces crocatus TaxID=52 RepID=A0A0K1EC12_CHOCO|nr:phytanoyl-CoA dioxygenase family protein [Chondromyces crocatus]AKT38410.1 uncharacterized protein CMC5_025560 [Chondromyces crocatus]
MHLTATDLHVDFSGDLEAALAKARHLYATFGGFVAARLFDAADLTPIHEELGRLIALAAREVDGFSLPSPRTRFDEGFHALHEEAPAAADAVIQAARRLTTVHELSVNPRLLSVSRRLMGTELVMSNPYKPIRVDYAEREHFLLPWHQDYPYAQDSMDAVVHWIPLQDVDEQNGCLKVAPGSHELGVVPVKMILPPEGSTHGIRGLQIADPSVVERFPQVSLPMKFGDVLVFSTLLLHRSQLNLTGEARWTAQVRHGNFEHPLSVQKRWPRGHYERHWFDETHPEYVRPAGS